MKTRILPALALIFSTLLALIVVTSASVYQKTTELQQKLFEAQHEYRHGADLLIAIRSDIYSSIFAVQNYLLDPTDESRRRALSEVADTRKLVDTHLSELRTHFAASANDQLERLSGKLAWHWQASTEALNTVNPGGPESRRLSEGTAALGEALQVTRDLDSLNALTLHKQDEEARQRGKTFASFLFWITCLTLALGVVVSIASLAGIYRYQRESEAQRRKTEKAEADLRHLSLELLKAQEEERKHISRELHDEVGQLLTGLRIELGNLQRGGTENGALSTRIEEAKGLAEQSLRSIRNMAMLLRPSMLDDQGLAPAIKWQAREFSRRFEIPVNVQIDGSLENVSSGHGVCLYRVIQEVLTNCAKHAKASQVHIAVQADETRLLAIVEDDGVGFERRSREDAGGVGLLGVAERIREQQGTLEISSMPGRGTRVKVELPNVSSDVSPNVRLEQ